MSATETAAAAAGTAGASTSLSNRREIPVTSFDFLEGAYRRINRSRRIVLSFAGLMGTAALTLGALTVPAWGAGSAAAAEAEILLQQRQQTFDDLGTAAGVAVGVEELIGRHLSMQDTYRELARRSPNVESLLAAALQGGGDGVGKIEIGYNDSLVAEVPHAPDLPEDAPQDDRTRVRITVQGEDLAQAAGAALAIRNDGAVEVTLEERAGVASILLGGVESVPVAPYARTFLERTGLTVSRTETLQDAPQ